MSRLEDKVVVVTGGSRGIGKAIVKRVASEGAKVVINYSSNRDRAEEVKAEIQQEFGSEALVLGFDVGEASAVDEAFSSIVKEFGTVDALVNNAGIAVDGLLMRTKVEDLEKIFRTNVYGSFLCAKSAGKIMMKKRTGRIVNLSSVIGEMGNAGQSAYSASKSAIFGFTKSLAKELGGRGITVNAITPGFIATDMTADMTDEQREALLASVALGRLGSVEDISGVVSFLLSDDAGYITGQILGVNGGLNM